MTDKKPPTGPNTGYGGWGPVFREWMETTFKEPHEILEFGSGLGTRYLCELGHEVHSVEHNIEWVGVAGKATYYYAPIKHGWYDIDYLDTLPPTAAEIVIIDGPPGTIGRGGILNEFYSIFLELAGVIVVDDVQRGEEMSIAREIAKRKGREIEVIYDTNGKMFAVI